MHFLFTFWITSTNKSNSDTELFYLLKKRFYLDKLDNFTLFALKTKIIYYNIHSHFHKNVIVFFNFDFEITNKIFIEIIDINTPVRKSNQYNCLLWQLRLALTMAASSDNDVWLLLIQVQLSVKFVRDKARRRP